MVFQNARCYLQKRVSMIFIRLFSLSLLLASCSLKDGGENSITFDNPRLCFAEHLLDDNSTICLTVWLKTTGLIYIRHKASNPNSIEIKIKGRKYVRVLNQSDVAQLLLFCDREIKSRSRRVKQSMGSYDWIRASLIELSKRLHLLEQRGENVQQ